MIDDHHRQGNKLNGAPLALPAQSSTPTPRILVVEDDQDILQLNSAILGQAGYHVETAANGAIAWNLLQHATFDLLVTDNEMPGVTGVELLKKLRAARMALPVIMATGAEPREEFARDPWLRPAATLLKPYTLDELLVVVAVVLRAIELENAKARVAAPFILQARPAANKLLAE